MEETQAWVLVWGWRLLFSRQHFSLALPSDAPVRLAFLGYEDANMNDHPRPILEPGVEERAEFSFSGSGEALEAGTRVSWCVGRF